MLDLDVGSSLTGALSRSDGQTFLALPAKTINKNKLKYNENIAAKDEDLQTI